MKFSLKDMFWSVSLLAIGLTTIFGPHLYWYYFTGWMGIIYDVSKWAVKGALLGAGIGALFRRKLKGAIIGALLMIPIYIAMLAYLFHALLTHYH